jgi:AraC-like DNA-binding protein
VKSRLRPDKTTQKAPAFFSPDVAKARRFYLDLNPPKSKTLAVICGGLEHCKSNYIISRKSFPFYSIEYVARGTGELNLKGRDYPLQAGRLFSYGPGIPHQINGKTCDPMVKYFVDFAGIEALNLLRSCGLPPGRVSEVFPANALRPLFDELIHAGLQVSQQSAELCAKLLDCLRLRIGGARAPLEGTDTLAFETYQQCRQYIEKFCLRLRTLEQIAADCHVNDAYLCRLFRRYDHQSPYQYLLRLKMNHAAERLQRPGALVKQVAEDVGFSDPFHFSRVFTSIFGLSPMSFRHLK